MVHPLRDAFDHHVWATVRLIDACRELSPDQLDADAEGTYGSILSTMRHLVGSDSWYLFDITEDPARRIDEGSMGLAELRAAIEADGEAWSAYLDSDPNPTEMLIEIDEVDGFRRDASVGLRLAQALHHGTDHRSQICTALTTLGVEPPGIDVWDFGVATGRSAESPPPTV